MKKKLLIELIIYAVIVVIGIILLFTYEPKQQEIIIPSDFKIEAEVERGETDVTLPNEQ